MELRGSVLLGIATGDGQGFRQLEDNCRGRRKRSVSKTQSPLHPLGTQRRCLKAQSHPGLVEICHNKQTCFPSFMMLGADTNTQSCANAAGFNFRLQVVGHPTKYISFKNSCYENAGK